MRKHSLIAPIRSAALIAVALVVTVAVLAFARAAHAHPHVFIQVHTTVLYENGTLTGFQHAWTFDELYTAMAIEGLDKNGDKKYDRSELAELAKVNMEGLREFSFFTFPKLGGQDLKLSDASDSYLEHKNDVLTLHFTVKLEKPVLADAKDFTFMVTDPSFYIALDLAKTDGVKMSSGAPSACRIAVGAAKQPADSAQKLGESFFSQLGGNYGISIAQPISVGCG
jgi:ABC-type uncharacterized transport system substrate-binding protein